MYKVTFFNADSDNEIIMNSILRRIARRLKGVDFQFTSHLYDLEILSKYSGCCVIESYGFKAGLCLEKMQFFKAEGNGYTLFYSTYV